MRRTATVIVIALALASILAAGLTACGGLPKDAVATVGQTSITQAQFDELVAQATAEFASQGTTFPAKGTATYDGYAARIVAYLVQNEIVAQSAAKEGITVSDAEVSARVAQVQKAYGGKKKMATVLKQQGMTMDLLKRTLRAQLLTEKVGAEIVKSATVTAAEVRAYWDAHKAQLVKTKSTATFAKAKQGIRSTLLAAAQQKLWSDWVARREKELGVKYAAGYDPASLSASPSASSSASPTGSASPSASPSAASGG